MGEDDEVMITYLICTANDVTVSPPTTGVSLSGCDSAST